MERRGEGGPESRQPHLSDPIFSAACFSGDGDDARRKRRQNKSKHETNPQPTDRRFLLPLTLFCLLIFSFASSLFFFFFLSFTADLSFIPTARLLDLVHLHSSRLRSLLTFDLLTGVIHTFTIWLLSGVFIFSSPRSPLGSVCSFRPTANKLTLPLMER